MHWLDYRSEVESGSRCVPTASVTHFADLNAPSSKLEAFRARARSWGTPCRCPSLSSTTLLPPSSAADPRRPRDPLRRLRHPPARLWILCFYHSSVDAFRDPCMETGFRRAFRLRLESVSVFVRKHCCEKKWRQWCVNHCSRASAKYEKESVEAKMRTKKGRECTLEKNVWVFERMERSSFWIKILRNYRRCWEIISLDSGNFVRLRFFSVWIMWQLNRFLIVHGGRFWSRWCVLQLIDLSRKTRNADWVIGMHNRGGMKAKNRLVRTKNRKTSQSVVFTNHSLHSMFGRRLAEHTASCISIYK